LKGVKAEKNIVCVGAISAFMEHMVASIIRELENGKPTVRMDKVNQLLICLVKNFNRLKSVTIDK
jgi:hypothetical protein